MEQTNMPEWANEFQKFPEPFKLKDGETKTFTFLDNGTKHEDHKNKKFDIVFIIESEGTTKALYINAKSYSTLTDIKELGFPLVGKKVTMSRKGTTRFDTRYTITQNPDT